MRRPIASALGLRAFTRLAAHLCYALTWDVVRLGVLEQYTAAHAF